MQIYLIRHAEPAYPADELTPRGHRQARALARRLGRSGVDALYSSPMGRARATAGYAAEVLDLPVTIEPWMEELESWTIDQEPWGESPAWEVDPGRVRQRRGGGSWHAGPPFDAVELGPPFAELGRASDAFLERLGYVRDGARYRRGHARHARPAVFCHCGFGLTWLAYLLAIPPPLVWAGFTLEPCSLTTIAFEPDAEGSAVPRCLALGDRSHLRGE